MAKKNYSRRAFFQKTINKDNSEQVDVLFEKYSRKELGNRKYSDYEAFLQQQDIAESRATPANSNTAQRIGNITSGLAPYAGTWSEWEVIHLLRRTSFGNKKTDVATLLAAGMSGAVDAVLNNNSNVFAAIASPSAAPLNYAQTVAADPTIALGNSWTSNNLTYSTATSSNDQTVNNYRFYSMQAWQWGVWLNDGITVREKMVQFWYHFIPIGYPAIDNMVNNAATLCNDYMSLLRTHALGNFKDLIKAITKNPAMLIYLSNHYSTAAAPNENYARELMELFMIGKEPQNYTEQDVQVGAKVLSGWRVASFTNAYPFVVNFYPTYHNQSNKTFSSFFNNTTINNVAGAGGSGELDTYFNMLFQYQSLAIANYICKRLYRYFVYYDIDTNVQNNVITPLANTLIASNWEILPVLSQLFKSEHFFDMANRGVMIKSPFDLLAGTIRTLNIDVSPATNSATPLYDQYRIWRWYSDFAANNLGQGVGLIPDVSGWKAYYQNPTFYQNWINSNTIQKREERINAFISGQTLFTKSIKINAIAFLQQFDATSIQSPGFIVDTFIKYLLPLDLSPTQKTTIKQQTLLSNQVTDAYWTTAWNNYLANPNTTNFNTVNNKLVSLFTYLMRLAEYQLM